MNARILPLLITVTLTAGPAPAQGPAADPREVHLADLRQLTRGGENAEAYWSPDGGELVFQSTRPPYECDQIFRTRADGSGAPALVSNGKGRTTCAYFTADGRRIVYSSTHHKSDACPPPPDRSRGYVWPIDPAFEIWSVLPDGSGPVRLTDNDDYDAETTVCPKDGSLLFTSMRDGDLELYRMDADGKNVKRLTNAPGYDGGAFFSPDCSKIVWRASRPKGGAELDDYRALLARGLVRPGKLEIWVAKADGGEARQITYLDAASFAPSFFPAGDRIVFSSNYGDPKGREFEIWAVGVDGTGLTRLTWSPGFDGFPLFSPDGSLLAFASNRNQGKEGETNVFVARWVDRPLNPPTPAEAAAADRFADDVRWLADDAREGRGIGTQGLEESSRWLAQRFEALGVAPGGDKGTFFQSFDVPVAVEVRPRSAVSIDGKPLAREAFRPLAFSVNAEVSGDVVAAGYGITASELGIDDYKGVDAKGKIVVVRRFTPAGGPFEKKEVEQRYGDLRYKAWNAREHGALGLIVVDLPEGEKGSSQPESPLPALTVSSIAGSAGDAGIPVVALKREAGALLFQGAHQATLKIDLEHRTRPTANVVGVIRAGAADRLPGAVLVGAHYDHLGQGGASSLSPDSREIHNGADDNASGTAALLEVARELAGQRDRLKRDVWLVAFSGEEIGVLGSTHFVRHPPEGLAVADLAAMLNMDMVGRLRGNLLTVSGRRVGRGVEGDREARLRPGAFRLRALGRRLRPLRSQPLLRGRRAGAPLLHRRPLGLPQAFGRCPGDQRRGGGPHRRSRGRPRERARGPPRQAHLQERPRARPQGRLPLLRRLAGHRARLRGRRPPRRAPLRRPAREPRRKGGPAPGRPPGRARGNPYPRHQRHDVRPPQGEARRQDHGRRRAGRGAGHGRGDVRRAVATFPYSSA